VHLKPPSPHSQVIGVDGRGLERQSGHIRGGRSNSDRRSVRGFTIQKFFSAKIRDTSAPPFRQYAMADWYTKTVLTVIAVCLLFLAGRDAVAPSRNFELSQIVKGLDDVRVWIDVLNEDVQKVSNGVQKVAICDVRSIADDNCVVLRSKLSPHGPVLPVLPVPVESEPRVNVVR
jgi:hypothetical protein